MSLPGLRTERLRLEPVTSERHLALLVDLNADPEVMRLLLGRAATPQETEQEWARRLGAQSDPQRGLGYWAGYENDAFAGWWSASSFAADRAVAGLGYRLPRAAWGRGLASEGARAMLEQAFSVPGVERVVASTMVVNTGSRRVLDRVGLRLVRTWVERRGDPIAGWEQGEAAYEVTRQRWQESAGVADHPPPD